MKFLNNLSKNTTDVIGAIIAVIIFWLGVQYFTDFDIDTKEQHKETTIQLKQK